MFSSCFKRLEVATVIVEEDEELKNFMTEYRKALVDFKQAKTNVFSKINEFEENYRFKSDNEKLNKENKKDLLKKLENSVVGVWTGEFNPQ